MSSIKIISTLFVIYLSSVRCSVAPAVALAQPGIAYTRIAPPSTLPFAASVSTFTKGLNVYAAPYAAGVAPLPYFTRSLYPSAPVYPSAYSPNYIPAGVAPAPAVITSNTLVPSPLFPNSFRVSPNFLTRSVPVPAYPGYAGVPASAPGAVVPSSLLPAPFGVDGRAVVAPSVPVAPTFG
ncbi:actin cytoskeleton-regulatory complex protein PAN1-like [Harmonia axyridis]|uniref:actin cytoskeleton-regulatory complex protein PAN1-like n=1 Tax=Harmonia axyridis TaxID=115357 RepID=UPI001E279C66|nr:actin cytoskeleton-regulatory complex protein PAN1-like [Harmonia axyridis]